MLSTDRSVLPGSDGSSSSLRHDGDVAASALAEHTLDTGHPLNLTKAEVIDHHPHTMTQCLFRELAHSKEPRHTEQGERHPT